MIKNILTKKCSFLELQKTNATDDKSIVPSLPSASSGSGPSPPFLGFPPGFRFADEKAVYFRRLEFLSMKWHPVYGICAPGGLEGALQRWTNVYGSQG